MNNTILQFKENRQREEFDNPQLDMRLKIIIYALAGFTNFNFNKAIVITELFRTQAEQDLYYKDNPDYQKKRWLSVHQEWRGCDCSVQWFTDIELTKMQLFLEHFNYQNPSKPQIKSYLIHDIGLGKHLHLQTDGNNFTEIEKTI